MSQETAFDFNKEFEHMMTANDLDTVVLCAHINPDGDAAGSVMGLAHYIGVNYPQYTVYPYLSEKLDRGPKMFVDADPVYRAFETPAVEGKRYAVIACDTANPNRMIGSEYLEQAAASMAVDHHAANIGYAGVNHVRISESCAENIFFILNEENLKKAMEAEAHPNAADYIYLGILHDTSGFLRAKPSTLLAASKLLEFGVEHNYVMQTLLTETLDDLHKRSALLNSATLDLDGKVAGIFLTKEEKKAGGYVYEDIHPISGLLRDCVDIEMAYSMFEEEPGIWRCSFRSDGKWINVNELLQPFGGGGHAGAAGLRVPCDDPEKLRQDILARAKDLRKSN